MRTDEQLLDGLEIGSIIYTSWIKQLASPLKVCLDKTIIRKRWKLIPGKMPEQWVISQGLIPAAIVELEMKNGTNRTSIIME